MRGKLHSSLTSSKRQRITPADAGKTAKIKILCCSHRDHPRGCGENRNVIEFENRLPGSPPRMRGKLYGVYFGSGGLRITPADAGKTCVRAHSGVTGRDHPRGCGENERIDAMLKPCPGSPPRMRGKRFICDRGISHERITPADAGKTSPLQ